MKKIYLAIAFLFILGGCATSKVSTSRPASAPSQEITTIAIAPGSGVMGDAISVELFNLGYTVVDANEAMTILARAGLREYEVTSSTGYAAFRERGINAVLVSKASGSMDGRPESASVRVTDTMNGNIIAAVTWQNGWGGIRGSMADRTMRKNLTDAATEIAQELDERLR